MVPTKHSRKPADMNRFTSFPAAAAFTVVLTACSTETTSPDYDAIMDRTVDVMDAMNREMAQNGIESASATVMEDLTGRLHAAINAAPSLYKSSIGLGVLEDASFEGFDDKDADNEKDLGEERLFTLEIDAENERLVCTDYSGQQHGYRIGSGGFFAGALLGGLMSRQRDAGVDPNRFSGAQMRTTSRTEIADRKSARTSARSGGSRSGK